MSIDTQSIDTQSIDTQHIDTKLTTLRIMILGIKTSGKTTLSIMIYYNGELLVTLSDVISVVITIVIMLSVAAPF